jgi:phage tail-like protein
MSGAWQTEEAARTRSFEAVPSCRFYVQIGGQTTAVFTEVSGLQAEMETLDVFEGGENGFVHRLPGRIKVGNLSLKRGMTTSNDFYKWFADVASGYVERRNVSLIVFDVRGEKLATWNFDKAYPVKWSGPQLQAAANGAAIETLELAYDAMRLA